METNSDSRVGLNDQADNINRKELHENKVHFQNNFPYNTYICSIPMDFTNVPLHWHREFEIIIIKKGSGIVTVNFQKYQVSSGDIIIALPGSLHSIEGNDNVTMHYENILFSKDLLTFPESDLTWDEFLLPFFSGKLSIRTKISHGKKVHGQLSEIIDYLDDICDKRPYGYQLAVKGAIMQIIYLLITNPPSQEDVTAVDKSKEKIKSIIRYISTHYTEEITIDEIAGYCHYSPSHFMKFFKAHTGMSFINYLNDYRVTEARTMLANTTDSILDISLQCGFTNLSNFNRIFKRKYGISPRQMRKQLTEH